MTQRAALLSPLVWLLALMLAGGSAHAAQDLLHIWRTALANDPVYAAARAQYRVQREAVPQARAGLLPDISAGADALHQDSRAASSLRHDDARPRAGWSLTLTQPLFDRAAWRTLEQSRLIVSDAALALAIAYQDIMLRSAQAYFDVLAAQDTLTAIEAEKASIAAQRVAAQRNFELGNATITDTHEAQARHDLILATELQARYELDLAHDALGSLIGTTTPLAEPLATLPLGVVLPAPQPDRLTDWIEQAQSAALTVQRAQLGLHISQYTLDIAQSGHYPRLELRASTRSASDLERVGNRAGRGLESVVGIHLNVPLYSGGITSSRVTASLELTQKARYDFEDARRRAVQEARRYFTGVHTGLARIRALEAGEQSSRAALAANRTGYEIGVRVNLDVLDAQRQLYTAQRDLARARYDTLMAGLRLRAITGILSETDLQAINQLLQAPQHPAP